MRRAVESNEAQEAASGNTSQTGTEQEGKGKGKGKGKNMPLEKTKLANSGSVAKMKVDNLIAEVEREASELNLKLKTYYDNRVSVETKLGDQNVLQCFPIQKCVYITMNCTATIRFDSGDLMKKTEETTYLGSVMTRKHLTRKELEARLGAAMQTVKRLRIFFKKSQCSSAWKLQVYNAVILSKLLYGLETLELIDSLRTRLDAFQIRGLRHILKIDHSYWSHETNQNILDKAELIARKKWDITEQWTQFPRDRYEKKRKIKLASEILDDRKQKLLGHIMRSPAEDPLYQVTFDEEGMQHLYETRRVGRPRHHWVRETLQKTFAHLYGDEVYIEDDEDIIFKLFCAAQIREF